MANSVKRGHTLSTVPPDGLRDKRYVTAILRLLLDKHGELVHGEVADMDCKSVERFVDWRDLAPAVRAWLESRAP